MSAPTEPADLLTEFTFLPASPDLAGAVEWLRDADLGFEPREANVTQPGPDPVFFPFDDTAWDKILHTPGAYGFDLDMGNVTRPRLSCRAGEFGSEVQLSGVAPPTALIEALLANPALVIGASGDGEDANWQGEQSPQHYEWWYDGDWQHLPRTVDKRGRERIDVSRNPGRRISVVSVSLWAAQDLWFGPHVDVLFDPRLISSLPVGEVTDLGEGRWHVRLWEDGTPLPEVRRAQQALRDHLEYDAIAARPDEVRRALTTAG